MRIILILISMFITYVGNAQENYYSAPVKIPLLLSGSFAELRSNHFHSGIDIKTQGTTGIAVSAAAEGYVSRISVSPTGFGNALYINHPNGTTTVYAHLAEFRYDIQQFIKDLQYKQKSFKVDVQLLPIHFPVEKDEWIALSGNSGSSGGPHLHFEIRNTQTEMPLNPLNFGFNVTDKTPPTISGLQVTPLTKNAHVDFQSSKKTYPVVYYDGAYHLANNPTIPVYGKIGFAFEAIDYFDGSPNKCGINFIQLKIDGELYFSMQLNKFSFDETRYINSFVDFEQFILQKRKFQKTYIDPGNQLSMYVANKNRGIFKPTEGQIHQVEIEVEDAFKNRSVLKFNIISAPQELAIDNKVNALHFNWNQSNRFILDNVFLEIEKGNLYDSFDFEYKKLPAVNGYLSDLHQLGKNTISFFNNATLKIRPISFDENIMDKALLVSIDPVSGKYSSAGGKYENGWVTAEIKNLGIYAVRIDTVAPVINPLSITNKNTLTENNRIRFKINDELSGIDKIDGYLDGIWALFEYDAKNNLITHYFDEERFEMNREHQLKLLVSDYKNNTSYYEATFYK